MKEVLYTDTCNGNKTLSKGRSTKLGGIETYLDQANNKSNEKKNENLNEKLNVYKKAFDDVIKLGPPEMSKVLKKIHNGYIDVIQKLIGRLNTKTTEFDSLIVSMNTN